MPDPPSPRSSTTKLVAWLASLTVVGAGGFAALRAGTSTVASGTSSTTISSTTLPDATAAPLATAVPVSGDPAGAAPVEVTETTAAGAPAGAAPPPTASAQTTTTFAGSPDDPVSPGGPDAGPSDWPTVNGCDAGYLGVCIPKPPARVTCDQISETNFQVVGNDAQGLDPDGNGVACEHYNLEPNPDRTPEELEELDRMD